MLYYNHLEPIEHFSFSELTRTDTGLFNKPDSWKKIFNLINLAYKLEEIREYCGFPIVVNSAYRTTEVNAAVGGVEMSMHTLGCAADIRPLFQSDFPKLVKCCEEFFKLKHLNRCIVYRDKKFIHIENPCVEWDI